MDTTTPEALKQALCALITPGSCAPDAVAHFTAGIGDCVDLLLAVYGARWSGPITFELVDRDATAADEATYGVDATSPTRMFGLVLREGDGSRNRTQYVAAFNPAVSHADRRLKRLVGTLSEMCGKAIVRQAQDYRPLEVNVADLFCSAHTHFIAGWTS